MARKTTRPARQASRFVEAAAMLVVAGAAILLAPLFLKAPSLRVVATSLRPFGLTMIPLGVGLFLLTKVLVARTANPASLPSKSASKGLGTPAALDREEPRLSPAPLTSDVPLLPDAVARRDVPVRERPLQWRREVFDVIEWRRFEAVIEALFRQAGFETTSQSHGADEGVDVWLYSRHQPGQPVSLVQCKHWHGKRVGVDKVRELRGVMASRNVKRGQFATTSTFTPDAAAFAQDNGINLLDVDALLALIGTRTEDEQAQLLAVALDGDYWRPTCVNCGIKLVERSGRNGSAFWGCARYPKCRTTMQMRSAT